MLTSPRLPSFARLGRPRAAVPTRSPQVERPEMILQEMRMSGAPGFTVAAVESSPEMTFREIYHRRRSSR
jgi:hypothetical protein